MKEGQIHEAFIAWLEKRGIPFRHDRMDKPTTTKKGEPDFAIYWMGRVLFIEIKTPKGALSDDQKKRIKTLRDAGCRVAIARSVASCIDAAQSILCEVAVIPRSDAPEEVMPFEPERHAGEAPSVSAGLFVGDIGGKQVVFKKRDALGRNVDFVRNATLEDIATLPRS